ncbi:unnamed protein product [Ambrosiozyma monospora]|uniref:Unnamed protein product n=1 Tax=Ambrosiozyma monospora TaxID=43982 RepID=A0ACB5T645_AMBMO|nr:unnamed protein product [Ambrosiozyma monospora]
MSFEQTNAEQKSLEQEHAEIYEELLLTVDKLLTETKLHSLSKQSPEQLRAQLSNLKSEMQDLDLTTIHSKEADEGTNSDETLLNESLEQLLKLRLDVLNQHLITYPNLKIIHGQPNQINYEKINALNKEKDAKNIEYAAEVKNSKTREQIQKLKRENYTKMERLQQEMTTYLDLVEEVNDLKSRIQLEDREDEELYNMKVRYTNITKKNLVLSQFNMNLISSLSNVDLATDPELLNILLDCGSYNDYGLFGYEKKPDL